MALRAVVGTRTTRDDKRVRETMDDLVCVLDDGAPLPMPASVSTLSSTDIILTRIQVVN